MERPEGPGGGLGPPEPPQDPPTLCRELWGSREAARYREDPRGGLQRLVPPGAYPHSCLRRAAAQVLLPQGYPESVSPDYLQYQCWDALQALCSTLTGALATRAVLQAVGVGDSAATVTGATLTWVLRDGVGMVTRITFAWLQGSRLDCEAKQWRLAADVLNDAALVLELLAPAWPRAGPALLTLAAATKCIVGVAGGATRAALAVHQARRDNMADVAAKDSSQETLVNGAGLLLALLLLPLLEGRPWLQHPPHPPLGCPPAPAGAQRSRIPEGAGMRHRGLHHRAAPLPRVGGGGSASGGPPRHPPASLRPGPAAGGAAGSRPAPGGTHGCCAAPAAATPAPLPAGDGAVGRRGRELPPVAHAGPRLPARAGGRRLGDAAAPPGPRRMAARLGGARGRGPGGQAPPLLPITGSALLRIDPEWGGGKGPKKHHFFRQRVQKAPVRGHF